MPVIQRWPEDSKETVIHITSIIAYITSKNEVQQRASKVQKVKS